MIIFLVRLKNSKKTHWFLINLDYFKNFNYKSKIIMFLFIKTKKFFYILTDKFYFNIISIFILILFYKKKIKNNQFYF